MARCLYRNCDARIFALYGFPGLVDQAAQQRRDELLQALDQLEQLVGTAQQQRDAALDALADRTLSPRLKAAYAERAEAAVEAYETRLEQQRTVRVGLAALDDRMRTVGATL